MEKIQKPKPHYIGHRGRVRDKLLLYGPRMLESYELLEALLFYVIPYKDTKPLAKRLISELGGLYGVLHASVEELMRIEGVGEACARFLISAGDLYECCNATACTAEAPLFDDYKRTGEYVTEFFKDNGEANVLLLLLSADMRLVGKEEIRVQSFGSAAVRPDMFVKPALRAGAEVAVIAYTHPYGPLFPTEADRETGKLLFDELSAVGVALLEQYIVSGDRFVGIGSGLALRFSSHPMIKGFIESKLREEMGANER